MQTLIVEIESSSKGKELSSVLSSMSFVKKVSNVKKPKAMIVALQVHEQMKKAIVKKRIKQLQNTCNEGESKSYFCKCPLISPNTIFATFSQSF
jgi:hypothetical protein